MNIPANDGHGFRAIHGIVVNSPKRSLGVVKTIPGFDDKFPSQLKQYFFVMFIGDARQSDSTKCLNLFGQSSGIELMIGYGIKAAEDPV